MQAPYNFVPLNDQVVIPHWGNCVSHDIPFKDGESGKITITMKSESPIFVRNGTKKIIDKEKILDITHEFSHLNINGTKKYFIPGTSTKGMLRNILEIMTFGKMSGRVNDSRYAVRDLRNQDVYTRHFQKLPNIHCGWLYKDKKTGTYKIEDCDNPGRISYGSLSKQFDIKNLSNEEKVKSKIEELKKRNQESLINYFKKEREDKGREIFVKSNQNEGEKGTVVFTGPINKKKYEFIFFDIKNTLDVDDKVINDFFFAYFKDETNMPKADAWDYWSPILFSGNEERIPVFFMLDGNRVKHLGLSYLYKLPYNQSIEQSIKRTQQEAGLDFADII